MGLSGVGEGTNGGCPRRVRGQGGVVVGGVRGAFFLSQTKAGHLMFRYSGKNIVPL